MGEETRWERLAELAAHGANIQPGQVVSVSSEYGQVDLARAVSAAAYRRGAKFVDVFFYDARVKDARIRYADPETLDFVPPWYGERMLALGDNNCARISLGGLSTPKLFQGLDPALVGRDRLPWLKEVSKLIADQSTNWCIVPCPHREWSQVVYPDMSVEDGYERLWQDVEHVLRLDEPDPNAAWDDRMAVLKDSAQRLTDRRFDAIELRGPATELSIGLFASGDWLSADFNRRDGLRHFPNLPTEEVFTSPDPERVDGHVTSTKPLVLRDGTIIRGLRVRFEGGRGVEIEADENAAALQAALAVDDNALRLGELALVDNQGRIGPLGTIFYDTLLDENAASHIAFGSGFPFAIGDADRARVNESGTHIDFMIGAPELDVDGVTATGERVPVLRGGSWQI